MSEYLVIVEGTEGSYSAYAPDLPGCIAAGETLPELVELMRGAIAMHLEGLKEDSLPIPAPASRAEYIAV